MQRVSERIHGKQATNSSAEIKYTSFHATTHVQQLPAREEDATGLSAGIK